MTYKEVEEILKKVTAKKGESDKETGWNECRNQMEEVIREISERGCWNCLYEYQCNWEPAGRENYCDRWRKDEREKGKEGRTDNEK